MLKKPGDICDAYIPDYSAGISRITGELGRVREYIAARIQQVLVLSRDRFDCRCLPIFPEDHEGNYPPVGNTGFVHPLLICHIAHKHFRAHHSRIPVVDFTVIQQYIQGFYTFSVQRGCQRIYWSRVPTSEMLGDQFFALKSRPVIKIRGGLDATDREGRGGLYVPATTNRGTYTAVGPLITNMGDKPGIVGHIPLFLPESFSCGGHGAKIDSEKKKEIQVHLMEHMPNCYQIFFDPLSSICIKNEPLFLLPLSHIMVGDDWQKKRFGDTFHTRISCGTISYGAFGRVTSSCILFHIRG